MHELPTLLLNGFMGVGKSTVGRLVAGRAGAPFIDLDERIAARAGRDIPTLFVERGEAAFRALEREELARVLSEGPAPAVVALGGGALLDRKARREALRTARVVTLTAAPSTVAARTAGPGRPLLDAARDREARIAELIEARSEAYAEAHARLATDGLAPEHVAAAVERAWRTPSVAVPLGEASYGVRVVAEDARGAIADAVAELRPSAAILVTDTNVAALAGRDVERALAERGVDLAATVVLEPGEPNKNLGAVERVLRAAVEAGADRDAVVVGLGGGVVTDITGFAAATLLRGVRWVAAPTTLLAMVDASVGGKTGVDLGLAKNAVGAFHQPSAVVAGVEHTETESPRGFASGLAEVVKAAALGDPALLDELEQAASALARPGPERPRDLVLGLVLRSVSVKAAVVTNDERETGRRAVLNFGHTLGHALEAEGGYRRLLHGEAVALGMVAALEVGCALGVTDRALAVRITRLLARLGLPTDVRAQPLRAALPLVALDKKRRAGALRVVLLRAPGEPVVHSLAEDRFAGLVLAAFPPLS